MSQSEFSTLLPEILLTLLAVIGGGMMAWSAKERYSRHAVWVAAVTMAAMSIWVVLTGGGGGSALSSGSAELFGGLVREDAFSALGRIFVLGLGAGVLIVGQDFMQRQGLLRFEYPLLVILAVLGMLIMVSAGNLILVYLGIELQALALYALAAMRRDSVRSTEAGLKFFLLGGLGTALFLFGSSLLYGLGGSVLISELGSAAGGAGIRSFGFAAGLGCVIAGLGFRLSMAPFHFWIADVEEGAPAPVAALIATAAQMAAMLVLARILIEGLSGFQATWQPVIAVLALGTMVLGALGALGQSNIKRMLGFMVVAQGGFALTGLAAGGVAGVQGMLLHLMVQAATLMGVFAFLVTLERNRQPITDLSALTNLARADATRAMALALLLLSLTGLPPLIGFIAKLVVMRAVVAQDMIWLILGAGVAMVILLTKVLGILRQVYFAQEGNGRSKKTHVDKSRSAMAWSVMMLIALGTLAGGMNLMGADTLARGAAEVLVR